MATCASAPFDHVQADVILRSADGVDFRVFKLFLSLSSPFFETMFSLPQGPNEAPGEIKDGLPIITVSEDSKALDSMLRFCYPSTLAKDPSLDDLADILSVIAPVEKYSLHLIKSQVCQAVVNPKLLEKEPFRCFAIARNARLKNETIIAARYTLRESLIPVWFAEIELITISDLLVLLTYHKQCSMAVRALMSNFNWITDHYGRREVCSWLLYSGERPGRSVYSSSSATNCTCGESVDKRFFIWNATPVRWWATFMEETSELLVDRPGSSDIVRREMAKTIKAVRSAGCRNCSERVAENMTEFGEFFILQVEKAVDQVKLNMNDF